MDRVELLGLRAGQLEPLLGDDAQAAVLEEGVDLAGEVARVASGLMIESVRSTAMTGLPLPLLSAGSSDDDRNGLRPRARTAAARGLPTGRRRPPYIRPSAS